MKELKHPVVYRVEVQTRNAGFHFVGKEYYSLAMAVRWYCYYEDKYNDGNHVVRLYAYRNEICLEEIEMKTLYD